MNSAIKAAAGLLFTFSAAISAVQAAPDIATQTFPFNIQAFEAYPSISADGRYVAFKVEQRGGPSGGPRNIYVHDMVTGKRVQANITLNGAPADNAGCDMPSISANGRYVVFGCRAADMGGVTAGGMAYFVYDRETNSTQMIPDTGDDRPNSIHGAGISADGRFVAFRTQSATSVYKIFVRDMVNKTTSSTNPQFAVGPTNNTRLTISADGRYIAYLGRANIGAAGTGNASVYDRVTGVTQAVDVRPTGIRTTGVIYELSMSEDASAVVFSTTDSQLISPPPATSGNLGTYVRDLKTGKTELVSVAAGGHSPYGAISGNGRYVAYAQGNIMYVYDRLTKITRKIILSTLNVFGPPRFSSDGRYLVFTTANTAATQHSVTIADLGVAPGVTLSTNTLTLTEGGNAGTYSMSLTQAPDADVKITAGTSTQLSLARNELMFTSANWSSPQVISVQAVADGVTEGKHTATIVHTVSSTDTGYSVVQPANVTVTISDGITPTIVTPGTAWTRAEMPLTGTAAPGSTVLLTAANRSTGWLSAVSTVADAQGNWSYMLSGYTDGILDLDAQADGVKSVVRSVNVTLTVTPPAPTYIDVTGYIRTTALTMAYNRVTGKYVGTFMLTNTGSIPLAGPLHVQFDSLTTGVKLDNASGSHDGSPYITVPSGLEPDGSVTISLIFDNPARVAIGYTAKIYSGNF